MKEETEEEPQSSVSNINEVKEKTQKEEKDPLKETEEKLKPYKQLTGFLVERKVSQEEIEERYEWIQSKRQKLTCVVKDQNHLIRKVYFPETYNGLYCARFSSNGEIIATCFGSGCIQLRNGETGRLRTTLKSGLETSFPVTCCRFHPVRKEILYAGSASGSIFICQVDKIIFWKFVEEMDNEINSIDIDVTGEHIVSGGKDSGLRVYDAETGKKVRNYYTDKNDQISDSAVKYHHMRIFATKCHKTNRNIVVTGGWDDTVKIWDIRVASGSIRSINGPHICGDAIDLQDAKILTGSWAVKNSLQIWDMVSGKLIETINPTNRTDTLAGEYLYSAQYYDGDPYGEHVIVGGSGLCNVEVINLKEKNVVASYSVNKAVIAIDSYKTNIVYGGMDSTINIAEYN